MKAIHDKVRARDFFVHWAIPIVVSCSLLVILVSVVLAIVVTSSLREPAINTLFRFRVAETAGADLTTTNFPSLALYPETVQEDSPGGAFELDPVGALATAARER
jgi:hypothetical protein